MTDQILKRRDVGRRHRPRDKEQKDQTSTGEGRREAEEQLKKIDDVLAEYRPNQTPVNPSVIVGEEQPHQVVKPLSDEEVVKNFHQIAGE